MEELHAYLCVHPSSTSFWAVHWLEVSLTLIPNPDRGKPKQDAGPLDTKKIVRFSLMMRSHFGAQDGEFSLSIKSISAIAKIPKQGLDFSSKVDVRQLEDGVDEATQDARYYVWRINHMLCQVRS